MTPSALFVLCIIISIFICAIPYLIFGELAGMFSIALPLRAVESITRNTGLSSGAPSLSNRFLLVVFVSIQILVIAFILFVFFCLLYFNSLLLQPSEPIHFSLPELNILININRFLLLLTLYGTSLYLYQYIRYHVLSAKFKTLVAFPHFKFNISVFLIQLFFLITCYTYLCCYPALTINIFFIVSTYVYALSILYGFLRFMYFELRNDKQYLVMSTFKRYLNVLISVVYFSSSLYLLYKIHAVI